MKTIMITISPTGETKIETKGFDNDKCIQASKHLEDALGIVGHEQKTAEYYSSSIIDAQLNNSSDC